MSLLGTQVCKMVCIRFTLYCFIKWFSCGINTQVSKIGYAGHVETCRACHLAGISTNEELISYFNHLYFSYFHYALNASKGELIIVVQSYECLVLYINNHNNPFPSITKVKTANNVPSCINHVNQHVGPSTDSFHTWYRLCSGSFEANSRLPFSRGPDNLRWPTGRGKPSTLLNPCLNILEF